LHFAASLLVAFDRNRIKNYGGQKSMMTVMRRSFHCGQEMIFGNGKSSTTTKTINRPSGIVPPTKYLEQLRD
jgi:hypothetical protein